MARSKDNDEQKKLSESLNSKKRIYNKRNKTEPETNTPMAKTSKDSKKEGEIKGAENTSQENVQTSQTTPTTETNSAGTNEPIVQKQEPIVQSTINENTGDKTGTNQTTVGEEIIKDSNPQPNSDYNPLGTNVDEKNYMKKPDIPNAPEEVIEPIFNMSTVNPVEAAQKVEASTTQILPSNSALNEMDPAGKRMAAEQLVDLVLKGYSRLLDLGKWYVRVDKEEIMELQMEGKNSPSFTLPMDDTGKVQITLEEYVTTFNTQSNEALSVSQDFITKVREPMIRICIKKGWGVTDEEYLIYLWGEELAVKGSMIVGFKRSMNKTITLWTKLYYTHTERDHNGVLIPEKNIPQNNNKNKQEETVEHNTVGKTADDESVLEKQKETPIDKKEEVPLKKNESGVDQLNEITTPVPPNAS